MHKGIRHSSCWPRLAQAPALLIVVLQPAVAGAQATSVPAESNVPTVSAMTLTQALDYARGHQPELRAARERFLAVAADARIAAAQWLPTAGATVEMVMSSTNNSTATPLASRDVDLPRVGGTAVEHDPHWQPYATTLAAIGARQEVFDFGRIAAQSTADQALVAIERDRLQMSHLDIALTVERAYYAVRAARAVAIAATQAEQRARVHVEFAEVAVRAGLRPPIERTRAAADLAKFTVGRMRAEGNIRIARSALAAAVGSPEPELDAADTADVVLPTPTLAHVEQAALSREPEILQARDRQRAQHARTLAIQSTLRPNLYASASVSGRAGGAPASNGTVVANHGFVPEVPNYDIGMVMSWPFLEPTVDAAARASRQREWTFDAELAATQQRARSNAQRAYRRTRLAESTLGALAQAAEAAKSNYEQAEARFRAGMGTATELADAESIRLEAEVQQVIGGFELATARAQLSRVMGD